MNYYNLARWMKIPDFCCNRVGDITGEPFLEKKNCKKVLIEFRAFIKQCPTLTVIKGCHQMLCRETTGTNYLGGGFNICVFSLQCGEMIHFGEHIFQMGGSTTNWLQGKSKITVLATFKDKSGQIIATKNTTKISRR